MLFQWDSLRIYKQEPVVVNGGLREYVEWFPTTVDNSQVFLNQTNFEIDELLDLDCINYPESGSTKQMNLKIHDINSLSNLDSRIKGDFEDHGEGDENYNKLHSLSEGHLPLDFYNSKESLPVSPYKCLSEEAFRKDVPTPEPDVLFPPVVEGEQIQKPTPEVEEEAEIKEIMEGDKAALLRQARKAAKPRFGVGEPQEKGDRRRERPESSKGSSPREKEPRLNEPTGQDQFIFAKPAPPTIDRSFKPVQVSFTTGRFGMFFGNRY